MRPVPTSFAMRLYCSVLFVFRAVVLSTPVAAQPSYVAPRIREPLDEGRRFVLKGNVHPLARAQFQIAGAPADLPMDRMLLVLKRSPEQEAALLKLLDDQQDKSSLDFHKWVTPEQFGKQFGPADADIHTITSWLEAHGFDGGTGQQGTHRDRVFGNGCPGEGGISYRHQ